MDQEPQPNTPKLPDYKGAPLDPDRGPGLGCFWTQVVLLAVFLVLTPLTVVWVWPPWISAVLLFATLILLLFVGQTTIFLLRLVAADRRVARRQPLSADARKTVGQLEDETAPQADVPASHGGQPASRAGERTSKEDDAQAG